MHNLALKFVRENEDNKEIYLKAIKTQDQYYIQRLVDEFYNYTFRIYFISYIEKSIKLKSLEIKRKRNKLDKREIYILNSLDEEFKEERINTIADESIDVIDEVCNVIGLFNPI
ncbi:hypothetical protein GOQ29_12800 [Clostridium sp. D2Q-14]|uniref:hypothetical protein n=1 Tax=Anaeromonas gelatinilytica TaxID=2683194 RepID=UPI00193B108E|nr:hypothetical protein [Anaeromonas gelatinilytica]MBS4536499.1 hypothetical protein [Anaeromonas gelatinilytica]